MTKPLPSRPSLSVLKYQAKKLLKTIRQGDAQALQRVQVCLPSVIGVGLQLLLNPYA